MKTILIVDDEYGLLEMLTELLQHEGYRVVTAANGKDGMARLEREKPDLVITDLMMPIADGRELVLRMRALPELAATPVILMSAAARKVALTEGSEALNVSAYLRKPFAWERLLDAVLQSIGKGDQGAGLLKG